MAECWSRLTVNICFVISRKTAFCTLLCVGNNVNKLLCRKPASPLPTSASFTSLADSFASFLLTKYLNFVYLLVLSPLQCLLTHLRHQPHLQVSLLSNLPLNLKSQGSFSTFLIAPLDMLHLVYGMNSHWSPRASSDTVSCTFSYHTWQFIIITFSTITACIFSYSLSVSFWTQDLALQQILSSIDLFLFYRTDSTDSRTT